MKTRPFGGAEVDGREGMSQTGDASTRLVPARNDPNAGGAEVSPVSRFVTAAAVVCLPLLTLAEGKCDDDPMPYGPGNKLVITWAIPYPAGALVKFTGEEIFNQVDQQLGLPWFPPGYPDKYKNPKMLELFNDTDFGSTDELKTWQKTILKIDMPPATVTAFGDYVRESHRIRGALVEHPAVPAGYSICSCVLQRGVVIYWGDGQQDLYVRSHFSTTNPTTKAFEVFAPRGGFWFSFRRPNKKIWFPLRLNKLLKDQAWMVLDVLTPKGKPLPASAVPGAYKVQKQGQVKLFTPPQDFEAVRVLGTFQPGQAVADLEIAPP